MPDLHDRISRLGAELERAVEPITVQEVTSTEQPVGRRESPHPSGNRRALILSVAAIASLAVGGLAVMLAARDPNGLGVHDARPTPVSELPLASSPSETPATTLLGSAETWTVGDWTCASPPSVADPDAVDSLVHPASPEGGAEIRVTVDRELVASLVGVDAERVLDLHTDIAVTIQCYDGSDWINLYGVLLRAEPGGTIDYLPYRAGEPFDLSASAIEGDYELTGVVPPDLPAGTYRWRKSQSFFIGEERQQVDVVQYFKMASRID